MSIGNLLTQPSIDALLALSTLDVLILLGSVLFFAIGLAAMFFYALRGPVYISATPSRPFWRRRVTHRVCACCVMAVVIFALV